MQFLDQLLQCVRLAAGRRTQAGDATDQWREQWRRRLECGPELQDVEKNHF